jgi:hypothetical protein
LGSSESEETTVLIEKEVLGPGTYYYEDLKTGLPKKWVVTSAVTKHLHDQGNMMLSNGLTVPVPCEHDFDAHPMTPADKLKNNAGWVKEFRMKGDRLFSLIDIQDEELAKKLPKTIRWTSPWVSSFTDGAGNKWSNVVAHLALTTRPRISKQAPFPSISAAMSFTVGESPIPLELDKPFDGGIVVSRAGLLVERDHKLFPEYPVAFSLYAGGIALSGDDFPPKKDKKDDKDSKDDKNGGGKGGDTDGDKKDGPPDKKEDYHQDMKSDVSMECLLADLLGALGIDVDGSVGEEHFKMALYGAAMAKIHELTAQAQQQHQQPAPTPMGQHKRPGSPTKPNPIIQQEQQPMFMSLEDIQKIPDEGMRNIALSMYNENVKLSARLDASDKTANGLRDAKLKEEGAKRQLRVMQLSKSSPRVKADLDAMLAMPSMALSMGEGGVVVDPMAQTLSVLEKGLADMPRLLTTPSADIALAAHPTDGELSQEVADAAAESLARMMGGEPQKKAG